MTVCKQTSLFGVALVLLVSGTASAQYGTRGSVDGSVTPIFQGGAVDLSQPPTFGGGFNNNGGFNGTVQNLQPVQPLNILPASSGGTVTSARGVQLGGVASQVQPIGVPQVTSQPISSGSAVTSVTNSDGSVNIFTGQALQGTAIQGFGDDLPLVAEDYATLDLDGEIRPGTIGRGLTATGQGREGRTENPGTPGFDSPAPATVQTSRQVASTSTSTRSSSSSSSSSSSGQTSTSSFSGAIRSGVSVPRPQAKPSGRSTTPARPATTTTTTTNADRQVASAAQPQSQIIRRAPRSNLVAGDALQTNSGLTQTPTTAPAAAPAATPAATPAALPPANETANAAPAQDQEEAKQDPRLLKILFPSGSSALPDGSRDFLTRLANTMKADDSIRVQLLSYASLPNQGSTDARRLSLSRALGVRSFLIQQGVDDQRILVRAEGDRNGGGEPDRMDIVRID